MKTLHQSLWELLPLPQSTYAGLSADFRKPHHVYLAIPLLHHVIQIHVLPPLTSSSILFPFPLLRLECCHVPLPHTNLISVLLEKSAIPLLLLQSLAFHRKSFSICANWRESAALFSERTGRNTDSYL